MNKHLYLNQLEFEQINPRPEYQAWLTKWLNQVDNELEDGNVSSSMCFQGIITELVLYRELKRDWRAVVEDFLTDASGNPLAYSENYGKRLYRFDDQWRQTPVHAVYTRFWIDRIYNLITASISKYASLIESFIQPNGWIYNPLVSNTEFRIRMKSEYLMSFAMGLEILLAANKLDQLRANFEAAISAEPMTPYLSAEFFRLKALETLGRPQLAPVQLAAVVSMCEAGEGYCDFSPSSKQDEYMGTANRTRRDFAVHSPLAVLHAMHIAAFCDEATRQKVENRLDNFRNHLHNNPLDIQAFQIRDVTIPFGTDLSPIEVIVASWLTQDQQPG